MLRVSAPLLQSELSFVVLVAELSPSLQGVGWEMQRASRCGRHLSESPWQVLEAGRALAVPARHLAVGTLLPLCSLGLGATGTPVPTVTVPRCCTLPSAKRAAKQIYQSSPTVWCYSQGEAETGWWAKRPVAHRHSPAESPCMWGSPEPCRMGPRAFLFQQLGLKVSGAETAWRRQLPGRGRAAWAPSASMFPAPSFVLAQAGERSWFNWQLCLWPGCYEKVFCLPL